MTIVRDSEMRGYTHLEGTRIAVYPVLQYHDTGYTTKKIADEFDLDTSEVEDTLEYARNHDVDYDS